MNHQDIVARIRNGRDTSTPEAILAILLDIIRALPPAEKGGLLRKDAGENILFYPPANCNVSISRVCYPDGLLAKVFTDSGPGGANGPAWNDDGTVEPNRWIEVLPAAGGGPSPIPTPDPGLSTRVSELERRYDMLFELLDQAGEKLVDDENRIKALEDKPAPVAELPKLVAVGRVPFIGAIRLPVEKA